MKKRASPKKLRGTETINGGWSFSASIKLGDITDESGIYHEASASTVTFPSGTFSGFQVGDIITIEGGQEAKKKKKVHVARRRKQERQETHTITNVSETTMTIAVNDLVTATKISETGWSVCTSAGVITI